jgi:hypothetical protein
MKTIKLLFLSGILLLLGTTGCIEDFTIRGNGIEASEARLTLDFNQVKSEGNFDVHITNGNEYDVVVYAESNIIPYIETNVTGGTLRIYVRGIHNINNRLPMEVYITTPTLRSVVQSGSGIITTDYFSANQFDAVVSGSGKIETAVDAVNVNAIVSGSGTLLISGESTGADLLVSGSGKIDAYDLDLRECEAKISGSGNMWVTVERYLKASISGSGNLYYSGTPDIEKHISGSGNVFDYN